ncbi:MAG: DUF4375 domain-containing protein [Solirubrobacterales bacterium]|nr:DUF4375 domain-containing protein [Solirubrobacterales bacterium]
MPIDCRVERSALEDEYELAPAIWEVLYEQAEPEEVAGLVRTLPAGQRALMVLFEVQTQVDNGGFFQFLDNTERVYVGDLVEAARLVGADRFIPLLQRVVDLEPDVPPWDADREGSAAADELGALDDAFFELCRGEQDLCDLAVAYVRTHPDEFFLPAGATGPPAP